jgi:lipopolysaccharide export system protein LptC
VNRYSTIVSWVKVALPMLALALLSTLFLLSRAPDPDAALPFADIDIEQIAREQRLSRPRFAGTLEDGRELVLISNTATPVAGAPNRIRLDGIEADLELTGDDQARLIAESGIIDLAEQSADLRGSVRLTTESGYRVESDRITVAMSVMEIDSPYAVTVTGPQFRLTAGAMRMTGPANAATLHFTGGVRLLYGANARDEVP